MVIGEGLILKAFYEERILCMRQKDLMGTRAPILGFGLLSLLLVVCCTDTPTKEQEDRSAREKIRTEVENTLTTKHGAISDWHKKLDDLFTPYSVDVEEALIRSDHKPIVFLAFLDDVVKRDGKYFALFVHRDSGLNRIHFNLEVGPEEVGRLVSHTERLFVSYCVVATVTSVSKPKIKVKGEATSAEGDTEIELDTSKMFIAKGVCIDFQQVPSN